MADACDVRVARCTVHDCGGAGLLLYGSRGCHVVEDCEMRGCTLPGIEVMAQATPAVRRNRVHHNRAAGILVRRSGGGVYEGNEVHANALANFEASDGAEVAVRGRHSRRGRGGW